jgi:hypothetical protein
MLTAFILYHPVVYFSIKKIEKIGDWQRHWWLVVGSHYFRLLVIALILSFSQGEKRVVARCK